jgi:hypothetical protein
LIAGVILFLVIDGVLHADAAFLVKGRATVKAEIELFIWAALFEVMTST